MHPVCFPLIILVECRLIMCDEDETKVAPRDGKAGGKGKGISVIVPFVEALCVFLPASNKHFSILHHIVSLMTVNIHTILLLLVSPIQPFQPVAGRPLGDCWLANPDPLQACLHFGA